MPDLYNTNPLEFLGTLCVILGFIPGLLRWFVAFVGGSDA